jgi:hypothetical protein
MIGRSSCARWGWTTCFPALLLVACAESASSLAADQDLEAGRWLSVCASDGDCGPDTRCLRGACTLACSVSVLDVCASMSADAVCDTVLGACDVPCGVSLACQVLGFGYVCEEDRCRSLPPSFSGRGLGESVPLSQ